MTYLRCSFLISSIPKCIARTTDKNSFEFIVKSFPSDFCFYFYFYFSPFSLTDVLSVSQFKQMIKRQLAKLPQKENQIKINLCKTRKCIYSLE
jgi:hypothetical protein